jgi:DNA-binding winged helix-turn-helix (wHTH) protein
MPLDQVHNTKVLYEFGPFRVDPDKETLLRGGELVPLTPKTFQILLVLVRHNREAVTKDDLMRTVWPDTFVEEANLSRNIFMLRKALGDNSQDRYIVTVPGRGYRLAEDVHLIPGQKLSVVAATHSKVEVQVTETKPWAWLAFAAVVVVTLVGIQRFSSKPKQALTEKDTVVLADFANTTGDPVFDDTLRQGMEIQLEQSPFLSLVSEPRIRHTLKMMGQKADTPLNRELGREVRARTGSAGLLEGSIASLGSQYVLDV